jgi:hypothetical protein
VPKRAVKLGPDALRQPKSLKAAERARLQAALLALGADQAAIEKPKLPFPLTPTLGADRVRVPCWRFARLLSLGSKKVARLPARRLIAAEYAPMQLSLHE